MLPRLGYNKTADSILAFCLFVLFLLFLFLLTCSDESHVVEQPYGEHHIVKNKHLFTTAT